MLLAILIAAVLQYNDSDAAFNLILEFQEPACAIIKHASPCGVALADNINQAFTKAFSCDSKSAFGGIVALNKEVDEELALELSKIFFEVIIAPSYSQEALVILSKKNNLRLLKVKLENKQNKEFKSISGGILVQEKDKKNLEISDLKQASNKKASKKELQELVFAMKICKHVKSNAIVITNNLQTIGIGSGQTSRVASVEIACKNANFFTSENKKDSNLFQNLTLASDAFFPFSDGIEYAAKNNIKLVIAPSGSIRDNDVIAAINKNNMALYFTDYRHFKH